jgi:hypothetical protein
MSSKLEDSTLTIWTCRDGANIGWVVNGNNDASSENNLFPVAKSQPTAIELIHSTTSCLPSLADVDNVNTICTSFPEVRFHMNLKILRANVGLSC